ncbi:MAG: isoprenylcysteine carboxylmethyltransferase family protein [Pseudomonadota bacterium]|nr:isoprenylcysteine carboxylmethyltransferase family protein [Pseudomonadota bacterium]
MTFLEKLKKDGAPIAVFGLIVGSKTYTLWVYLSSNPNLWGMLQNVGSIDEYGQGAGAYLTRELSYILYYITALAFDALVFYSFIVRGEAKSRPEGFWENFFPLFTVFVPVIGFTLLFFPQVRQIVPGYSQETLEILRDITPMFGFYMNMIGFAIGFIGAAFSIWAISHLKRSFGLRAAVRTLVTSGPYGRIRHPLYVGEIIHIFGIAILSGTPVGLYLFVVAVGFQVVRAKIEERKFLRTLPEYETYMANTGFLWPRLHRSG